MTIVNFKDLNSVSMIIVQYHIYSVFLLGIGVNKNSVWFLPTISNTVNYITATLLKYYYSVCSILLCNAPIMCAVFRCNRLYNQPPG